MDEWIREFEFGYFDFVNVEGDNLVFGFYDKYKEFWDGELKYYCWCLGGESLVDVGDWLRYFVGVMYRD